MSLAGVKSDTWGELERLQAVKIRRPVRVDGRRPAGGEWDWFYALRRGERAAISRDFMDPLGIEPDVLAGQMAMDIGEAMDHWLACVRMTRRGGRLGDMADEWAVSCDDDTVAHERVYVDELVGPAEIAERLGVQATTVHQWRWRHVIPDPVTVLTSTPIWRWADVEAWAQASGRL